MTKLISVRIKEHRVGIGDDGANFELAAGDIVELPAEEAERMIKAGAAKHVNDKAKA